jgi:hypothetical protein
MVTRYPVPWWRRVERIIGWASLGFAAAGLVAPQLTARGLGLPSRGWGRVIGVRDLALGVALVRGAGPTGLAVRAACDVADAGLVVRRQRLVALGALASGAFAAGTALAAGRLPSVPARPGPPWPGLPVDRDGLV